MMRYSFALFIVTYSEQIYRVEFRIVFSSFAFTLIELQMLCHDDNIRIVKCCEMIQQFMTNLALYFEKIVHDRNQLIVFLSNFVCFFLSSRMLELDQEFIRDISDTSSDVSSHIKIVSINRILFEIFVFFEQRQSRIFLFDIRCNLNKRSFSVEMFDRSFSIQSIC